MSAAFVSLQSFLFLFPRSGAFSSFSFEKLFAYSVSVEHNRPIECLHTPTQLFDWKPNVRLNLFERCYANTPDPRIERNNFFLSD